MDLAIRLVEEVGIGPEKTGALLKGSPALEIANPCSLSTAVYAFDLLLESLDGQRVGDDCKVFLVRARREVDEVEEVRIATPS